jgi:hypothetical protein
VLWIVDDGHLSHTGTEKTMCTAKDWKTQVAGG